MKRLEYHFITVLFLSTIFIVPFILSGCSGQSLLSKEVLASPDREMINYALSSNGATAESPDDNPEHPPSEVIDGDTSSLDWDNGGGWEGSLSHLRLAETLKRSYVQVNLQERKQVKKIVIYTIDSPKYPADKFGLDSYRLEYWHGTGWERVDGPDDGHDKQYTVRNNKVGQIVHHIPGDLVTDKVRLVPTSSNDTEREYSLTGFGGKAVYDVTGKARVMEIEVWGYPVAAEVAGMEKSPNLFPFGKAHPSPEEQAIHKILAAYEQGYDNENLEQVMSVFSDNFSTVDGKKKIDIEQNAAKFFEEYTSINITLKDPRLNIAETGETAAAEATYILECNPIAGGGLQRRSGMLTFNFQKEDDENWRIVSAK